MRLVYTAAKHVEVKVGDKVRTSSRNEVTVEHFAKPHKPESSGKVTVKHGKTGPSQEIYVGCIGAEWIEREDQAPLVNETPPQWKIVEVEVNDGKQVASITLSSPAIGDGIGGCIEIDIRILNGRKVIVECEDLITGTGKGFYLEDEALTAILVLK